MEQKNWTIDWGSLWKVFFLGLFVWLIFAARDILVAFFLAIVISSALDPLVSRLEKNKVPRLLGTLIIYIAALFGVALIIYTILPLAISELNNLLSSFDRFSGTVFKFIDASAALETINQSLTKVADILLSGGTSLLDVSSRFLGSLALTASVFVLSFYLTVGRDGVEKLLVTIIPSVYEDRAVTLYNRVRSKIGKWFAGQVFLSLAIGFGVFLGLWLLGVKYSLILGILAAVLEIVPYVGPIFSGSLAVLIGLTESLTLGIYVLILFVIVQQIENHILVPAVTSLTTNLNPAVILISLMIGAQVFGFVGLILAVPAAVIFQEVLESWSSNKIKRRGLGL
ncbi:MAG: AI-2E family transporter [Patescibacteria group bacterium]